MKTGSVVFAQSC